MRRSAGRLLSLVLSVAFWQHADPHASQPGSAMTKLELAQFIARDLGVQQQQVSKVIQHLLDLITKTIVEEGGIELRDFGAFRIREYAPRKARNPRTGEAVDVPAKMKAYFKPGRKMKKRIGESPPPAHAGQPKPNP